MSGKCENCGAAEARMREALAERDAALLELARAREALNAARLAEQWRDEPEVPAYPLEAGVALPVPLRYRVADAINRWAGAAPALKNGVKSIVRKARGR